MKSEERVSGSSGGQHWLGGWIDHQETYGPHVMRDFLGRIAPFESVLDIGAGSGRDLGIAKSLRPTARTIAVEAFADHADSLRSVADDIVILDIERAKLPFADESLDVVMANQVMEHVKEIFWIFSEVTRTLKVGGRFIMGVPNLASLHNRLLLALGRHPTQWKSYSAHVRPFTKRDAIAFTDVCFPGGYALEAFAGSQFYPFPRPLARRLSAALPSMAFSIFFMFRKTKPYAGEFLAHPVKAKLETNFYLGESR